MTDAVLRSLPRGISRGLLPLLAVVPMLAGCELTEEVLAPSEDVVVVEGLVQLRGSFGGQRILVFLHRTVSGDRPLDVPGARVTVSADDGDTFVLPEAPRARCVAATPQVERPGTCYFLEDDDGLGLAPGERLELAVETAAGERLRSATTIPTAHTILNAEAACWIAPDTQVELVWSASDDAWAYFAEALIEDLGLALEPEGIEVEQDPLYLTGISVSSSDTTITFPAEFGVFDRGSLDTDVALRLQRGIPAEVISDVAITAVDRNYTNWVRGGNFNPSGQVRIPSVRGEGTGYFGSSVVRSLRILSADLRFTPNNCVL